MPRKSPKHVNGAFGVLVERFMTNKSIYVTYGQAASRKQSFSLRSGGRCVQYANMAFSFSGIGVDNRCVVPSWIYVVLQFSVPFNALISLHYIVIHHRLRSWWRRRSSVDLGQVVMLMGLSQFSTGSTTSLSLSGWPVPQIDCEMCPCLWCLTRQNKQSRCTISATPSCDYGNFSKPQSNPKSKIATV